MAKNAAAHARQEEIEKFMRDVKPLYAAIARDLSAQGIKAVEALEAARAAKLHIHHDHKLAAAFDGAYGNAFRARAAEKIAAKAELERQRKEKANA